MIKTISTECLRLRFSKEVQAFIIPRLPSADCYMVPEFQDGTMRLDFKKAYDNRTTQRFCKDYMKHLEKGLPKSQDVVIAALKSTLMHLVVDDDGNLKVYINVGIAKHFYSGDISSAMFVQLWVEDPTIWFYLTDDYLLLRKTKPQVEDAQ